MLDWLTIALMLTAGLLHASWHAIVKSGPNRIALLAGMGMVASAVVACALPFVSFPSAAAWAVIAVSVVLHVGYKFALVKAYSYGDLGQAFPLARGLVPLFATAIAFVLLGEMPSGLQMAGIAIVSAGLLWMANEAVRGGIDRRIFVAACAAGFTVAGYTALDAYGTRLAQDWAGFTAWLIVADCSAFLLLAYLMAGNNLWAELVRFRKPVLLTGMLGVASFSVFLWALSRAPVGPVSALRESSVLFAALIGMLLLGERASMARIGGAGLIAVGLVIIAALR